jgi:hypothetical protein
MRPRKETGGDQAHFYNPNKYNPRYNLQTMNLYARNAKLGAEEI